MTESMEYTKTSFCGTETSLTTMMRTRMRLVGLKSGVTMTMEIIFQNCLVLSAKTHKVVRRKDKALRPTPTIIPISNSRLTKSAAQSTFQLRNCIAAFQGSGLPITNGLMAMTSLRAKLVLGNSRADTSERTILCLPKVGSTITALLQLSLFPMAGLMAMESTEARVIWLPKASLWLKRWSTKSITPLLCNRI